MKCKVCGCEVDPQRSHCNRCGSALGESVTKDTSEFSWNTIDFPKPRAVSDIEMNWGQETVRARQMGANLNWGNDAPPRRASSFVQPQTQAAQTVQQPQQVQQPQPSAQSFNAQAYTQPQMPVQPQMPQMPQMHFSMPQQMAWTMPASTWAMPTQQQVVIPQPYNVQPATVVPSSPTISPMPTMPTQPSVAQPVQAPFVPDMSQISWTMPQTAWTAQPTMNTMPGVPAQPSVVMPQQAPVMTQPQVQVQPQVQAQPQIQPQVQSFTQSTMQAQPAAVQSAGTVNVDEWLDGELKDAKPSDDRFFTFYKKNEDFQKLLDEEYQRYKTKYDTNAESLRRSQVLSAAEIGAAAAAVSAGAGLAIGNANASAAPQRKISDDTMEINTAANIAAAKAARDAMVSQRQIPQPVQPVSVPDFDDAVKAPEHTMIFDSATFSQSMQKDAAMKTALPSEEDAITDFDKMMIENTTDASSIGEATLAISNEALRKEINELAQKIEEATSSQPVHAYDRSQRQQKLQEMANARSAFFAQGEEEEQKSTASAEEIRSIFDQWDKERQEAENKKHRKKSGFGRFILILFILLLLFAGADFLSLKFMPTNEITKFFNGINTQAVEIFNDITGKKVDVKDVTSEELTKQEIAAKNANKNIKQITFDVDSSKYSSQGDYGFKNLGSTTVVTDEETIVALTKVIVGYNSSWIDYVNEGTDISCFNYLKTDGAAFRAASNFDKIGKTEEYKKLNIGEIRKDASYYYVFTNEQIQVTAGSTVSDSISNVVYQLTQVGENYMIVECDSYS